MEDSSMKTSNEILKFTSQVAYQHFWRWLNEIIQEKNFNGSIKSIVPRNTKHSPTFSFTGEIGKLICNNSFTKDCIFCREFLQWLLLKEFCFLPCPVNLTSTVWYHPLPLNWIPTMRSILYFLLPHLARQGKTKIKFSPCWLLKLLVLNILSPLGWKLSYLLSIGMPFWSSTTVSTELLSL